MSMESTLWMGDIEPWMNRELILTSFKINFKYFFKIFFLKYLFFFI